MSVLAVGESHFVQVRQRGVLIVFGLVDVVTVCFTIAQEVSLSMAWLVIKV